MEIDGVWELTGLRRHAEALAALSILGLRLPESRDVLYLRALNLRLVNRIRDALAVLDQLERLHPRYSRLYQERGQCYVGFAQSRGCLPARGEDQRGATGELGNAGAPVPHEG